MTNILDQMEKDAEEKEIKSDDLKSISALAKDLNDLEAQIEEQQDVLNDLKNKYRQISEEDLPSKLEEVGMSEFKLSDGTSISVDVNGTLNDVKVKYITKTDSSGKPMWVVGVF